MGVSPTALFTAAAFAVALGELTDTEAVGFTPAAQVTSMSHHPQLLQVAAASFFVGSVLVVCAVAAAWRRPPERGRGVVTAGLTCLAAGAVWYATIRSGADASWVVVLGSGAPRSTEVAIMAASQGLFGRVADVALLAWLVGPVLVCVGRRRAGRAAWWTLVGYVVATVVEIGFAFSSSVVEALAAGTMLGLTAVMTRDLPGRLVSPAPASQRPEGVAPAV